MAYANPQITKFISDLEKTSGIVDERLRPAFQALLTTTKDLGSSYVLLNDAINISRGSGIDLATVSQDLANGYVGITRGLKKYNTGLTQAQLKSKSFVEIVKILNKQFSGASAAYLDTYSGKLEVLTVAADNAKESIGKGLIDAFARMAGGSSVQDAVKTIQTITKAINGLVTAVSLAVEGVVKLYKGLDYITTLGGLLGEHGKIAEKLNPSLTSKGSTVQSTLAKSQLKASTAMTKAQKASTAELKKQASLKKSGTVFDMEQIQLIAALKGKLSAEEKTRVEAQLALLNDNDVLAAKLTKDILMAQDQTGNLYKYFLSIGDTKINNPFAFLDKWVLDFQTKLNSLKFPEFKMPDLGSLVAGFTPPSNAPNWIKQPGESGFIGPVPIGNSISDLPVGGSGSYAPTFNSITVNGSILTDQMLTDLIQNGLQGASLSGSPSQIGRIQGMFGG